MLPDLYKTTQRIDFETPAILKPLVTANLYLGELKGGSMYRYTKSDYSHFHTRYAGITR